MYECFNLLNIHISRIYSFVMAMLFYFLLACSLFGISDAGEYDLTVEVEARKFQCFFQPVHEKYKSMEVDYQVYFVVSH